MHTAESDSTVCIVNDYAATQIGDIFVKLGNNYLSWSWGPQEELVDQIQNCCKKSIDIVPDVTTIYVKQGLIVFVNSVKKNLIALLLGQTWH